ncbi:MAG: LysM peptidoglycan-binding domain-containing protein [Chloroflexi bacterium]|nr:LysM peptidoglycan-binding domain-containing protein [Chloroflexota bacterium]
MFEHAILHWDGSNVQVENRGSQGQGSGQRTYTVASGDNLTAIARQFYGDGNQWHRIYDANRDKISDPNLIHPGQELVIP